MFATIDQMIGRTPLVRIGSVFGSEILLKLEKLNPGLSMKDRMAVSTIRGAEMRGELLPGGLIIESSSGNTATSLAMIAAAHGYRFIAVMDHHAEQEKIDTVRAYGGEVVLVGAEKPGGQVAASERLAEVQRLLEQNPGAFFSNQADNPDNPRGYETLASELRGDVARVDVLVGAIGSGGSLCGTARYLREYQTGLRAFAVEPQGSIIFGGPGGPYLQSGAGNPPGLVIARNVDRQEIDGHYRVTDREAFNTARVLARVKGILVGGSSGAAVFAAIELAATERRAQTVVVLAADGGERYSTTVFCDAWMRKSDLLDEQIEQLVMARLL